jgi:hypothetical protein
MSPTKLSQNITGWSLRLNILERRRNQRPSKPIFTSEETRREGPDAASISGTKLRSSTATSAARLSAILTPAIGPATRQAGDLQHGSGQSFSINAQTKGPPNGTQLDSWMSPAVLISGGTLLISTVGTISTIWLAWRNEARESREYALKIQQLEMEVTELRAKSSPGTRSEMISHILPRKPLSASPMATGRCGAVLRCQPSNDLSAATVMCCWPGPATGPIGGMT